jgi:hypothetical protein
MVRPQKAKRLAELVISAERILFMARGAELGYLEGRDDGLGTRLHIMAVAITQLLKATLGVKLTDREKSMIPQRVVFERAKNAMHLVRSCVRPNVTVGDGINASCLRTADTITSPQICLKQTSARLVPQ